jgi:hypothetical protein
VDFEERMQQLMADYVPRPSEVVMERWGQPVLDALESPAQYHLLMQSLPDPVRRVIATELLLWQVNNGGFWQYFYNSYGITIDDAIEGLRAIGEELYADVATRAKALFGARYPEDRTLRIELVGEDVKERRIDFRKVDDEFFALDPGMADSSRAFDALDAYATVALKGYLQ